jgi:hypothetical protein
MAIETPVHLDDLTGLLDRKRANLFLLFLGLLLVPMIAQAGQIRFKHSDEIPASSIGIAETHSSYFGASPVGDDIIAKLNASGVKWVRILLPWDGVEVDTTKRYRFRDYKANFAKLTSAGITIYICPGATNTAYHPRNPNQIVLPDSSRAYRAWLAFLKAAADTLKPWVHHWELTNEPNIYGQWLDTTNVEQDYLTISRAAADTIRSRDPQAVFALGGLSLIDLPFLRTCLIGGAGNFVTKVGIHPYRPWPELRQDTISYYWKPNHNFASPYASYTQEIQALKDTIAKYAPGLEIWDTEGCYLSDSLGWNPIWFNLHASEATQEKYLTRRYLMNLAQNIPLTTWTVAWDFLSLIGNHGKTSWANDYRKRRDYQFVEAPSMGLLYTPQDSSGIYSREAEDYSRIVPAMARISDPMAQGGYCLWTPEGSRLTGEADYDTLALQGLYVLWNRARGSGDTVSLFIAGLDTLPVTVLMNPGPQDSFRWNISPRLSDTGLIDYFRLGPGPHRLAVGALADVWDGSRLDAFKLVRVDTNCTPKRGYTALQSIATLFDSRVVPASLAWDTTNVSVPDSAWRKFYLYTFQDTSIANILVVPYWIGLIAQDVYPGGQFFNLTLVVDSSRIHQPILVSMLDGSFTSPSYRWAGGTATFDSLPAADYPNCLILDSRSIASVQREPGIEPESSLSLALYPALPNPVRGRARIRFDLPRKGKVRLALYNLLGQEVQTLFEGEASPGPHLVSWDGSRAASGVYFCRVSFGKQTLTRSFIHLR